jgi:3-dehydroquinate synthase
MAHIIRIIPRDNSDRTYDVRAGVSLAAAAAEIRRRFPTSVIFVITDSNVSKLHLQTFINAIPAEGRPVYSVVFPAGEESKTRRMKERIEDILIRLGADRTSVLVALGGGVTGDLAGFVASTLLRGIPYIQIPTTLLAQVDSSVGGKVGINTAEGKNLIGAFYQPAAVYADMATLATLPEREYRSGLAEVIKYGVILDKRFFDWLVRHRQAILQRRSSELEHIVTRCCELKRQVVQSDERESDYRRILNFGHTLGHAVESVSRYRLRHGEAIAIGMAAEAELAVSIGLMGRADAVRLKRLLKAYSLPVRIPPNISRRSVVSMTLRDKKRRGDAVLYTLPQRIGAARNGVPVESETVLRTLA